MCIRAGRRGEAVGEPPATESPTSASPAVASGERHRLLSRLDHLLAGIGSLPALDDARFLATHELYEGRSDQQRRILAWFRERIASGPCADGLLHVLSVGSGGGMLDVPLAALLSQGGARLRYVGVDPNRVECASFARRFAEAELAGAALEVVPSPYAAWQAPRAFDLVHFVHSLYYMPDPEAALAKARRELAPGGRLAVLQAPREALNQLAVRFYDKQYGRPTLFSEELAARLDAWGWRYEHTRLEARVDVTPFVEGDPELATALRDFIVQVDGRRLPLPVQRLVERYLRLVADEDGGRAFIAHPVDAFLIDG